MAGALDDRGWRTMFEMGADNPAAWMASAQNLLRAARVVGADVRIAGKLTDVIIRVQAMPLGLSIECSLKALWLKQGRRYAKPGAGFFRDGKLHLQEMPGAKSHTICAVWP